MARWKARGRLPISAKQLFSLAITVEVKIVVLERGVGHFQPKFQGERGVPHQRFWHQKTRVSGLSYGEKKIAENFNRLSRVHQRHRQKDDRRQTDRQTDGSTIAYSERNVVDVR